MKLRLMKFEYSITDKAFPCTVHSIERNCGKNRMHTVLKRATLNYSRMTQNKFPNTRLSEVRIQ